ncbi:unnamed protein product [Nyctereutes procyonoides]|uniref:(raccoon dog) hypothetical protein n=1 Tax=Nyctereutes procyonoides TaxID=34880 RepID=A0A811YXX4_NYCPR|nr:unnamed protein product [Nyctereutes procyonoides]
MQGARRGTRSRVSRITPWAEGGAKPLSPPGLFQKWQRLTIKGATKLLLGSCYYGAVHFAIWASEDKQNKYFMVLASLFKLLKEHKAQHSFCKRCGIQSFYTPQSNPGGFGIIPHCLELGKTMKEHKTIKTISKE